MTLQSTALGVRGNILNMKDKYGELAQSYFIFKGHVLVLITSIITMARPQT